MFRRSALVVVALALVACSNCDAPCREGITFYVAELAGSLGRGSKEPLHICFDGDCKDTTVTRDNSGGSIFLQFKGVGNDIDHDLTVTGVGAFKGEYKGKVESYTQDPGGDCKACALATVKIGADGKLTPAVRPAQSPTTTVGVAVPGGSEVTTTTAG